MKPVESPWLHLLGMIVYTSILTALNVCAGTYQWWKLWLLLLILGIHVAGLIIAGTIKFLTSEEGAFRLFMMALVIAICGAIVTSFTFMWQMH